MLRSRGIYSSSEEFKVAFIDTLTPGVIPRKNFINWAQIDAKVDKFKNAYEFYKSLGRLCRTDEEFEEELDWGLQSSDDPLFLARAAFELLGHTGRFYVSDQDYFELESMMVDANGVHVADEHKIKQCVDILCDLGLRSVVRLQALENYFIGVQVGLESHRRKNVGGEAFKQVVRSELEKILSNIRLQGHVCTLQDEVKIYYSDRVTSKKVDFFIKTKNIALGIEVNFYTASGSKPTEIKRSYGQVNGELEKVGVELVWVTDGAGYFDMKRSLKEARDIHKNIYNLKMLEASFENDLLHLLNSKTA